MDPRRMVDPRRLITDAVDGPAPRRATTSAARAPDEPAPFDPDAT